MTHTCSRCGDDIPHPVEVNANYVTHNEFKEIEKQERHYAMVHTGETSAAVDRAAEKMPERDWQALAAEMAHPGAPEKREAGVGKEVVDGVETAKTEEVDFSIPEDKFDHVPVDTPQAIEDDSVALVYSVEEDVEVQKTALVCPDCTKDNDNIMWGPDYEE